MADPIKMIAPGGLPPDLAAEAQKAAIAQQLATALLGSSAEGLPPTVRTAAGNPFARDVINLAPLGKMFQSYMGSKGLESSSQMMGIINALSEQQRVQEMDQAGAPQQATFHDIANMPGGGPEVIQGTKKPSPREYAMALLRSGHPTNQALGNELLKAGIATEQKAAGGDMRGLSEFDPASYPSAFSRGEYTGLPIMTAPEGLRKIPKEHVLTAPAQVVQTQPSVAGSAGGGPPAGPGTGPVPSSVITAPTPQEAKVEQLPDGSLAVRTPGGGFKVEETGTSRTAEAQSKDVLKGLHEAKTELQGHKRLAPRLGQMFSLVENADLGITAEWKTKARQVAIDMGLSKDAAGQVVDQQSLMKLALPLAIASLRTISSRPSQLEYINVMEKLAASPIIDPRAAKTVYRSLMIDALNLAETHGRDIESYKKLPGVGEKADVMKVELTPADYFPSSYDKKLGLEQDPRSGIYRDALIGTPESHAPVTTKIPTAKTKSGATVFKGKTQWWTTMDEAKADK